MVRVRAWVRVKGEAIRVWDYRGMVMEKNMKGKELAKMCRWA